MEKIIEYLREKKFNFTLFSSGIIFIDCKSYINNNRLNKIFKLCLKNNLIIYINKNRLIIKKIK